MGLALVQLTVAGGDGRQSRSVHTGSIGQGQGGDAEGPHDRVDRVWCTGDFALVVGVPKRDEHVVAAAHSVEHRGARGTNDHRRP